MKLEISCKTAWKVLNSSLSFFISTADKIIQLTIFGYNYLFGGIKMKKGLHPELKPTTFVCGCGNTFTLLSTKGGTVYLESCNTCHPFYAGKLRIKPFLLESTTKSADAS